MSAMRVKPFSLAVLFATAFTLGALLGRRWTGHLADAVLTGIALVAIILIVDAAIGYLWRAASWRSAVEQVVTASRWRLAAFLAAGVLAGLILWQLPRMPRDGNFTGIVIAWVLAFIAYTVAVAPLRACPRLGLRGWWRTHWRAALTLGGIALLGLFLRVWEIGTIPFALDGDEASFGKEALAVISGQIGSPFIAGHLSQPTMSFFYDSLAVRLWGPTEAALRLPWALVGAMTVPITFWMVARLKGWVLGFITATLLAVYHFHIHYSRLNLNNIADPFWGGLALLFFYRAVARRSPLDWVFAGAACAGALFFYTGARLVPLVILAIAIYLLICDRRRFWRDHHLGLLIALGAFLVIAAPMIQYAIRFPDEFNGRVNQASILRAGWMEQQAAATGQSVAMILFDQFRLSVLAFNWYPDFANFYGLRQPLLDPIFGSLFLLGLGYATIRALKPNGDRRLFPMVAWWWGGMILGGMLMEFTPSSQRLVTLSVPVCFFIALAMWLLVRLARKAVAKVPAVPVLAAGVVLFSGISLKTYLVDFTPQRIAGGFNAEVATALALALSPLVPAHRVYFFGAPVMYAGFPTLPFLVPEIESIDVTDPLNAPPPSDWLRPGQGAVFVFLPWRAGELAFVQQTFPNGEAQEIRRPSDQQVIATLFTVSP